jgi:L-amino acid N-acyltransferase YncA
VLDIVPITQKEAQVWIRRVHRHLPKSAPGSKFQIAVADADGHVRGVISVGRPVSRNLDDGWTLEVSRLATDGAKNACSKLYAAAWRAARALGYRKLITYILESEKGTTLKAAGWRYVGRTRDEEWARKKRPRVELNLNQKKLRWEKTG